MADIVVVGAGIGGLAVAARLAKLGHRVVVCERGDAPGGLLRRVRCDGFEWDATPMQATLPAVLRDLFRKSGRPIERYVALELSTPARRHVLPDGTGLDLPTGSRGAQLDAVQEALGTAPASAWTAFVDRQADVWELIRSAVLDSADGPASLVERRTARALRSRQSLDRLLRKELDDPRLRLLAAYPVARTGRRGTDEPAFRAVEAYVERTFGVWRVPGGCAELAAALLSRMTERSVDLRFGSEVTALRTAGDRVTGVVVHGGEPLDADLVVTAIAPQRVFGQLLNHPLTSGATRILAPSRSTMARSVTYLGLTGDLPHLPAEVVLHGEPLLVVSTGGAAPARSTAWTVVSHGATGSDVLVTMAERGLDVRAAVAVRLSGDDAGTTGGRSTYPLGWEGARAAAARAALARPLPGLHCLGTGLVLGSSVPYVAWQAAHVAELVGKA